MKLKNIEIISIYQLLQFASNEIQDISLRWELANYCEPLINSIRLVEFEIQKIKNKAESESDSVSDFSDNDDYVKLMNCQTTIEINKLSLSDLELLNIKEMSDLIILKPIVDSSIKGTILK